MTSDIRGCIKELEGIDEELKRLNGRRRTLHKRKKELEGTVLAFLNKSSQPGVKYRGTAAIAKEKNHRPRRKEADRSRDARAVLEKYGIVNSSIVYEEIAKAMKGEAVTKQTLKLTNYRT